DLLDICRGLWRLRGVDHLAALTQGGAYGGGVGGHAFHVPAASAQSIRLALFSRDYCLRRLRAGHGRLDVPVSRALSPCRSPQGRCGCGGLLLGTDDRRLSPGDGLAEALRQSPRIDRIFARCAVHAVRGPVWPGRSITSGLSLHRFLRLDHVAHTGVAGLKLGTPAPRPIRWDPVFGDHGWCAGALRYWLARGSVRPTIWNAVSVSHLRVGLERRRVGATARSQRNQGRRELNL